MTDAAACYDLLLAACRCTDGELRDAYRRLRELLEQLCRSQAEDGSLQMTDLAARIRHAASCLELSTGEENRLHTFRLLSNDVLNRRAQPTRDNLLRDAKTLAFLVRRLTGSDLPADLRTLLPRTDATYIAAPPAAGHVRRMRVTYLRRDDTYLYIQPTDTVTDAPLRVLVGVEQVNDEFAHTCRLLWPNAQLNLLDVDIRADGTLVPGFVVLEPDYLVDISSLAECYKDYGHHPANYLVARLTLPQNTAPLLVGNIANLFLDEWIHARHTTPDYTACMRKAFRRYPLELAACPELAEAERERDFFGQCRRHFDHIGHTVAETFCTPGYGLEADDAVLEPSYICEPLGLQGRLDYMQRDASAFIEMKSGKADEYSLRGRVEPRESHRVQMLLYQAVLEHTLGMDHRRVRAYLLYTRYPLLYPARPSWAMVRRAIDLRNRIVAAEYAVQRRNDPAYTARLLATIDSATLNERGLTGRLWHDYQAPAIDSLAARLASLQPLERAYFCTLYNFVVKEQYTAKSGDVDHEGRTGASALWLATLEEKREAGEILYGLRIADNHAADPERPMLTLALPPADPDDEQLALPNFRQGDAVLLYGRDDDGANVTNRMVFRASIERLEADRLVLRLRNAQQNDRLLPADRSYAIEHDSMDTGFRSMFTGLAAFLHATPGRRQLLLGQRTPRHDTAYDKAITSATDDYARVVLKAQAARDLFLLVGPPGTGKTSRALRGMVTAFLAEGRQMLLLSYTNRAVDEICKMLLSIDPVPDFIRFGSEQACEEAYRPRLAEAVLGACANRKEVRRRLEQCHIVVGTVSTLSLRPDLFRLKAFDVAIVDEATQILEPQLLYLLCARGPSGTEDAIGRFVLVGDHKQLPAVVLQSASQSEVHDEQLRAIGLLNLKDSLFERFYRRLHNAPAKEGGTACDMLCRQARMNVEVASFPNKAFYSGRLLPVGLPHQTGPLVLSPGLTSDEFAPVLTRRVAFLPSQPEPPMHTGKLNRSEAHLAARLATSVYRQYATASPGGFNPATTLGIIAPYRSQIALIRRCLASTGIEPLNRVIVDTVERFQGSERDVIIYTFCVSRANQLHFLSNLTEEDGALIDRKLNVALTRARKQLFLIGVPSLLALNPIYERLIKEVGTITIGTE